MPRRIIVDDAALVQALAGAVDWADFYRRLGYRGRPGGYVISRYQERMRVAGLEFSHLAAPSGPKRRWSDDDLRRAIAEKRSWQEVGSALTASPQTCRKRAVALGLDCERLDSRNRLLPLGDSGRSKYVPESLRDAAHLLATAWYAMHGYETFLPTGHANDDLTVRKADQYSKVQVKTTTNLAKSGAWVVRLTHRAGGSRTNNLPYAPGAVDEFFLIAGDGTMYRIPFAVVAGLQNVSLGGEIDRYRAFRVEMFA